MDIELLSFLLEPLGWAYGGWMLIEGQSTYQEIKYAVDILFWYKMLMKMAGIGSYRTMSTYKPMGQSFYPPSTTSSPGAAYEE